MAVTQCTREFQSISRDGSVVVNLPQVLVEIGIQFTKCWISIYCIHVRGDQNFKLQTPPSFYCECTRNIPAGQCGHRRYQRRQESFPILLRAAQLIPTLPSLLSSPRKWVSFLTVWQGFARWIYPRCRRGPRGSDTTGPRDGPRASRAGFRKSGLDSTHLIQTNM